MRLIHIDDGDALNIDCVVVNKVDSKDCKCFYSCDLIDQYEARLKADMATMLDKIRAEIKALPIAFTSSFEMKQDCLDILDKYKAESEPQESED